MIKLSALLIVNNEEKQLKDCLETLVFADEIIVILDKCNDRSEEIARRYTKKVFSGSWNIEGDRRNFGLKKCQGEWIFEIDADERAPSSLSKEIIKTICSSNDDWYQINLNNFLGKKIIRYGWGAYFGKSSYAGLFRNGCKRWGRQRVHPKIFLEGKKGQTLKNRLNHYYCKNISDLFTKLDSYSSAKAIDISEDPSNENMIKNLRRIFSRFWKCFFLRKGYKEKRIGLLIAIVAGLYPLISYIKFRLERNE